MSESLKKKQIKLEALYRKRKSLMALEDEINEEIHLLSTQIKTTVENNELTKMKPGDLYWSFKPKSLENVFSNKRALGLLKDKMWKDSFYYRLEDSLKRNSISNQKVTDKNVNYFLKKIATVFDGHYYYNFAIGRSLIPLYVNVYRGGKTTGYTEV